LDSLVDFFNVSLINALSGDEFLHLGGYPVEELGACSCQ
jgi:hypothetical protein